MEIKYENNFQIEKFTQYFYIQKDGQVKLIYPLHFCESKQIDDHHNITDEKQINHKQEHIKN